MAKKYLMLVFLSLIILVSLSLSYSSISPMLPHVSWASQAVLGAMLMNFVVGVAGYRHLLKTSESLASEFTFFLPNERFKNILRLLQSQPMIIGLTYVLLTVAAAFITRFLIHGASAIEINFNWINIFLLVVLVPVAEELMFRGTITPLMYKISGSKWAPYFSVLVFSAMHSLHQPSQLLTMNFGIVIGPLLLGAACELVMRLKIGLLGAISLHAAANASLYIFSVVDSRWLNWLNYLYIK